MKHTIDTRYRLALGLALVALVTVPHSGSGQDTGQRASDAQWERAELQWAAGAYDQALAGLQSLLDAPDALAFRTRIALLTGENWYTSRVADDARSPQWSPNGARIAFQGRSGGETRLVIVDATAGFPERATLNGRAPAFTADGSQLAYLTGEGQAALLRVRTLNGGVERTVALPSLVPAQVAFEPDGTLLVVAAPTGSTRTALYRVGATGEPRRISRTDSVVADLEFSANGAVALYGVGGRSPVQLGVGRGFARGPAREQFAVLNLQTGEERVLRGETPALSANGSVVAFTRRDPLVPGEAGAVGEAGAAGAADAVDGANSIVVAVHDGTAVVERVLHRTADELGTLAIAANGQEVTFQQRPREDWELFSVGRDGGDPVRRTREIQHDLLPQYLGSDTLLAVIGEARHRRSQLYVKGERIRLFHNNTVRTIAPEYEWVPSPDGTRILIVAERDGDTVTPHRHLWMVDLTREVTMEELRTRVAESLRAERALRLAGARSYAPIADAVRAAVAEVNTNRVFNYSRDLFAFDSKHISQPGNAKARAYLADRYRSFGFSDVRVQEFAPQPNLRQAAIPTANILAVLPGTTHPELTYVISSHFDSRAGGPGADDNTSGTAALLEAARVLASRPQAATIIFASFTGEESGLLGSREFVRQAKATGLQLVGALNNDMVGWANNERLDNTVRYSNAGIRDLQHAAAIEFTNLITYDAYYYKSTDAQAFYDGYGDVVGGIGSYPVLGNPHYHQSHDVLETINHQLVAEVAKTTVATIMYLASSPSRLADLRATPQSASTVAVRWTPSRERDVERYDLRWGPADDPERFQQQSTAAEAILENAPLGTVVSVKAVNRTGLLSWDAARVIVGAPAR